MYNNISNKKHCNNLKNMNDNVIKLNGKREDEYNYSYYVNLIDFFEQKINDFFPSIINTRTKSIKLYTGMSRKFNAVAQSIFFKPPYRGFSTERNSYKVSISDYTWKDINTIKLLERLSPFHNSDSFDIKKLIEYKYINKDNLQKLHYYINKYHEVVDTTNNVKIFNIINNKIEKIDIIVGGSAYFINISNDKSRIDTIHIDMIHFVTKYSKYKKIINLKIKEIDNKYVEKNKELEVLIEEIIKDLNAYKVLKKIIN